MAKVALLSPDHTIYALGVRALSSYLRANGHDVTVILLPGWDSSRGIVGERVRRAAPYTPALLERVARAVRDCQLIGVTATALTKDRAVTLVNALRPLGVPIVWGGIFATTCPESCLEHVDIVCVGEGEEALAELAERVERGLAYHDVRNLWVRHDRVIERNEVRPLIQDLDALPHSDYDLGSQLIAVGDVLRPVEERDLYGGWTLIHGTRGCPCSCSYCCNRLLQKLYHTRKLRHRSVDSLLDEISALRSSYPSVQLIWFTDDDFFARALPDLERFAAEYRRRVGVPFMCYANPNTLREDKLRLLLRAGLKKLLVGVQTGSDRVNRDIYKRTSHRARVLRAAEILNKYRSYMRPPEYGLILCNPLEDADDLKQTIALLRELPRPYDLECFGLNLFPGTELAGRMRDEGVINAATESQFSRHYLDLEARLGAPIPQAYLNSLIYWMCGAATPLRHGLVPAFLLDLLLSDRVVALNQRYRLPALAVNRLVALQTRLAERLFILLKETYAAAPAPLQRVIHRLYYLRDYGDQASAP